MDERRLHESLRRLPEMPAGEHFTAEVLARVERLERRRAGRRAGAGDRRSLLVTLAMAGAVGALTVGVGLELGRRDEPARPAVGRPDVAMRTDATPEPVPRPPAASAEAGARPPAPTVTTRTTAAAAPAAGAAGPARLASAGLASLPPEAPAGSDGPGSPEGDALGRTDALARLARLRSERTLLAARLAELRQALPPEEPPVVLLGGDERFELVFDLGRAAAPPPAGRARPAGQRPDDLVPRRL
jgi:hypothetical protein